MLWQKFQYPTEILNTSITDTRKSKILPVNKLVLFFCCSMFCLSGLPVEDVVLAREHYNEKTRCEKSQFIMDSIILHTSSTGQCSYYIGTAQVCLSAWRETLGIPESTFYSIKKQVSEGKKIINPSGKTNGEIQRKTQMAFVWLMDFTKTFASAMPDSIQLHLPCCLTKTSVYGMMKADMEENEECCISLSHFLKVWKRDLRHIAIPKKSRFSECTICALIKNSLSETKDKIIRAGLIEQRNTHLWQQKSERQKYYKHQMKARRKPDKYLSIIMDAMDQNKTMVPHFTNPSKSTDAMWRLKTHLLAAKVHGIGIYGFFDVFQWPHGSNLTITSLLNIIYMLKDSLPEVLYLQMDNCGRENKNRFVIAFLCLLVELGLFKKIKMSFLMKGHTHEDIDQIFSRFSVWLNRHDALTLDELMKGFEESYTPNPISILQSDVYNFSDWITKYANPMTRHSKPHVFKICNENGKAKIVCKKWSTDKTYMDCIGSMPYLLNRAPEDFPEKLAPVFSDIDKVKDTLTYAEPFMKKTQREWWGKFFTEKEEEESNFIKYSSFSLKILADHVREVRSSRKNNTPPCIPQILTEENDIQPVIIGKKTCGPEKKTTSKHNKFEVDQMVLTDVPKYTDEWPQVGKIVKVDGLDAEVQWFKGSKSGPWNPCTVPVPGKRGKRMPWIDKISCDEIWLSGFELTNKNCLPRQAKLAIDNFDN